ncbi:MAG: hypothetical protein JO055_02410 [Alphaproteobacteria bacterium]|nr:hypothetical protein [Alphaproteobacteria bacterium]
MAAKRKRHTTANPEWRLRFRRSLRIGAIALAVMLGIGILGYHYIADQEWSLAMLNASMILSGMGPVGDEIKQFGGRLFASIYALFSGLVFVGVCGILSAPWVHLFLHNFHADLDGES